MSYSGNGLPSTFKLHVPITVHHSNTTSTRLASTGASGYSGHSGYSRDSGWTGDFGTTSNLATKPRERDVISSQKNKFRNTDHRNFSSSLYRMTSHGHGQQDQLLLEYPPASSTSNLQQEEGDKPEPVDPRSPLRKLLDCVKELKALDVDKCLDDYRRVQEAHNPSALTQEEEYIKSNKSVTKIKSHDDEKDRLRKEVSELQTKLFAWENQDVTRQEVERIKKEYDEKRLDLVSKWKEELEKRDAETLEKETIFKEQIENLSQKLKAKDKYIEEIRKALSEVRVEKDQVEKEKTEALTRLSKEMSSKLNDKNPNITDLSDSNRPTKIAEMYNELYDNEWTDALEELTTNVYKEESAIAELLACLQAAYSFCQSAAANQIENLKRALTNPSLPLGGHSSSTAQPVNPDTEKMLEEVRKSQKMSGDVLLKEFECETSFKWIFKESIPEYTTKCLELCWLMNMHNPPVALGLPPAKDSRFDGNLYKEYTRTGTSVDYVVWLPLLLHKDGPLLQKGVLQPNISMGRSVGQKPRSAPANLTKSRRNKEQSDISDPQGDRLNIGGRTTQEPSVHGTNQERGTAKFLYGDTNPSSVSSYQQYQATAAPNYYSTDRDNKSSTITKSGSSKTSEASTYEYDVPYEIEYDGRKYVRFQKKFFTLSQWEEFVRKFSSGSSYA